MSRRLVASPACRICFSYGMVLVAIVTLPWLPVFLTLPALAQSDEPVQVLDAPSDEPAQVPAAQPAESPSPQVPEGYQVVMGDRWSFAVPSDWQDALTAPRNPVETIQLVAQLRDPQGQYIVNLVQETYEGNDSDYIQLTIESLNSLGFTIVEQRPIVSGEWRGTELEVDAPESDPPIRFLQRVVAVAGTGFALTCGGKAAEFEETSAICATILDSLQIAPVLGDG